MNEKDQFIFVYGTLRKKFDHPIHHSLSGNSEYLGKAFFRGILYEVGTFPGAVSASDSERRIVGELYQIHDTSKLLPVLDHYEGYHARFPSKSLFIRKKQKVKLKNGKFVQAWIYLYNRSVENLSEITSGDYVSYCGKNSE